MNIPLRSLDRTGQDVPTPVGGDLDNEYVIQNNDGLVAVVAINPSGDPATITVSPQATIGGLTAADETITVDAGATAWFGPFPPAIFNDAYNNCTLVDESGVLLFSGLRI